MDLIIVESPTKAKTLAKFLGNDYRIVASMGHVRDLPEKKLGIDVEHDFKPDYVIGDKKQEIVNSLKKAAEEAEKIILASDPDREGEAISWHIESIIHNSKYIIQRITFHEITEKAIKEALNNPGKLDMALVDAQQARRILDRLVGYKLSPLLWRKIRRGLSAGRVQSVAVRLIVEREREVLAFKPQEYWEILGKFEIRNLKFEAKLKKEIKTKDEADKIIESLRVSEFKISNISEKEVKKNPYPPFTTSTLQQAASNLFGWSAKKTMQVAQNLYEAGFITYHRTDSTNLNIEAIQSARQYIKDKYGEKYLPVEMKFYKTKSKVAQEAHEAIRPTNVQSAMGNEQSIDRDQKRLYELVWKRFLACQMSEAVYKQTAIDVIASGAKQSSYVFRANGNKVIFDGWQVLFDKDKTEELPELKMGQILKLLELIPSQHFTEPPPRYNEASLIKTLEEYGIGRPSTYAPIITTIQDRQYVEKEDKKLLPTSLGFAVTDFLTANFGNILDYKFTAQMEDKLDQIANGEKQWVPVLREFYDPFEKQLNLVGVTAERVKVKVETTDEKCPQCQSPLVVRLGRFGKFLACSSFPKCKFTKPLVVKLDIKCSKCGGDVVLKRTKFKKTFYGCSNYPTCDFASSTKPKIGT